MSLDLAKLIVECAQDKKSKDIRIFDVDKVSDICSYQILCSGDSERQTQAIAEAIEKECKSKLDMMPNCIEGKSEGLWILLDYGSILVHVFHRDSRAYYALERLWESKEIKL